LRENDCSSRMDDRRGGTLLFLKSLWVE
jgi:hypothetical protein